MANSSKAGLIFRLVLLLVLAGGAGAGAYYYTMREKPVEVTVARAERGLVTETVASITSGTVVSPLSSKVAAGTLGTVGAVHVKDGDRVEEGMVMVEINHEELDAQVELARANLKVAETRLEQARIAARTARDAGGIRLRQAVAALEQGEADHQRVKALAERQAVSASDLERASLALKTAREGKAAAEVGLAEAALRDEDIKTAEASIEQLRVAIGAAEAARNRAFVKAPFRGVVAKLLTQVGEAVVMGMPLLFLVQDEDLHIEAPFDEANLNVLEVGQRVEIEIDSCPDRVFRGTLDHISPVVNVVELMARNVTCRIRIDEGAEEFRPGMSADVSVITEEKENALFVPSEALVRDEYAFVVEDGRARRRGVGTGIGNWDQKEILDGLREGETIVTSISVLGLADGVPVTVVEALDN
ncbi:MAG: efflux RND transporter periplasmic adaptor subunit [Candidatus Hydrogenedens sp.]|nr:efflux RND transporter periplasmic adaptor subunit [Candidatus Hydrogenedentota bacterium]NLF56516.1 efflux RND transporter periplasmic adaptor subunit [Candidatus Hydrogenedens sp.]